MRYSKTISLIILSLFQITLTGQRVYINNEQIDTIFIKSNLSAYQFDTCGTTIGESELLAINFGDDNYYISNQVIENYEVTVRPKNEKSERKKVEGNIRGRIKSIDIQKLVESLSINQYPQETFSKLSERDLKSLVTKKRIKKIAKIYQVDWFFTRKYSSRTEIENLIDGVQKQDSFYRFLNEIYDTSSFTFISDYDNSIEIRMKTPVSEYRFQGRNPNLGKQPWYDWSKISLIEELRIPRVNYNFQTNHTLLKILPKKFLNRGTITDESLINHYIIWYLKKKRIII